MKLYATTTSERASKGQGGNDYLKIVIRNEGQQCIGHIIFKPDNKCSISILKEINTDYQRVEWIGTNDDVDRHKGEKKKGESLEIEYKTIRHY